MLHWYSCAYQKNTKNTKKNKKIGTKKEEKLVKR